MSGILLSHMKVALVHELLTIDGGAENVLEVFSRLFPDAPIYTLLYDEKKFGHRFPPSRVRTSPLQSLARTHLSKLIRGSLNHHLYLNLFPKAVESWDFSEFDLVISTSSAFAHGIITNGKPKHLCYVHSPARYLWDRTHDVIESASKGPLGFLKAIYLHSVFHRLRIWDSEAADRPDMLIAASKTVEQRIEKYWRRESAVIYPPVNDMWFTADTADSAKQPKEPYFLVVSSLVRYKRIDLAIEAANALKVRLLIVGEGPDRARLQALAGETVEFCGRKSHAELQEIYRHAEATIFPGDEDFGLVPLESMASGTPVIAYGRGGALETVIDQSTGTFFSEADAESLMGVLKTFHRKAYSGDACKKRAQEFQRVTFEKQILEAVDRLMKT